MAVTSPVSFTKIQTEFSPRGVSNNFSDYYKGGTYVKSTDIDPAPFISSTVAGLAMSQFLDSEYVIPLSVTLPNVTGYSYIYLEASDSPRMGQGYAEASITLYPDGTGLYYAAYSDVLFTAVNQSFTWLLSGSASDAYAFMDTPSLGSFITPPSSPTNTSLQLNTNRTWYINVSGPSLPNLRRVTSTLRIKNSSGTDLATNSVEMIVSWNI